jgi:serine/threonine protein kinase
MGEVYEARDPRLDRNVAVKVLSEAFCKDEERVATRLGSTLECLHTHFLDTGDFCEGAGVNDP